MALSIRATVAGYLKILDVKTCALVLAICLGLLQECFAGEGKNSPHVNYMLHCQGCHLPGGIGHPGIVPTLSNNVGKFLHVPGGREYLVQVPGSAQSSLDNAQLAEVLNWLVKEFDQEHAPQDFPGFTADEVAKYRSVRIRNVTQIRTELLGKYSGQ